LTEWFQSPRLEWMQYIEEGVRVGPAAYGLGVYSTKPFRPQELIGPISGTVMEDPKYESDYCMELGERLALEPSPPFRYLNHSCRPNCELVELEERLADGTHGNPRLWLEVLTEIAPGEQMTIDYNWPAEVAIPCRCGSADCRQWIVAEEELHAVAANQL
jgi:uncharacterized protein